MTRNIFLDGRSSYDSNSTIMDFALKYHIFKHDPSACQKMFRKPLNEVLKDLADVLFSPKRCIANEAAVIKAITLICLFDDAQCDFFEKIQDPDFFKPDKSEGSNKEYYEREDFPRLFNPEKQCHYIRELLKKAREIMHRNRK